MHSFARTRTTTTRAKSQAGMDTTYGVARFDTSLQTTSMPPRRAMATTLVLLPKSIPAHAMMSRQRQQLPQCRAPSGWRVWRYGRPGDLSQRHCSAGAAQEWASEEQEENQGQER